MFDGRPTYSHCLLILSFKIPQTFDRPLPSNRLYTHRCTVIPLNELIVSQRYAAVSPCRFDLIFAHTLAAYSAVRPLLKEACPSVPPPPPAKNKKKSGGFFSAGGGGDDYDPSSVVLTPHVIDVGADSSFHPSVGGTTPSDRAALGSATVNEYSMIGNT
jgi:hypothetical protein